MRNKNNKKGKNRRTEIPSESESQRLQREIEQTISEMESGVDRLRKRFKKMQNQLGNLQKHLAPDFESGEEVADDSEEIVWTPDAANGALMA